MDRDRRYPGARCAAVRLDRQLPHGARLAKRFPKQPTTVKRFSTARQLLRVTIIVVCVLAVLSPRILVAQGCALCYTQAAGSTQRFIQALRSGILILIVPPMFLSGMFTVMAYPRRNSYNEDAASTEFAEDHTPY